MDLRRLLPMLAVAACMLFNTAYAANSANELTNTTGVQGGLAVVVGCDDTALLESLASHGSFLTLGLDADADVVAKARGALRANYGSVSVDRLVGERLPLAEGVVNVMVVNEPVAQAEILRVLAPRGVALLPTGEKLTKPLPENHDDWTHYLYDATNNAVSHDTAVGPPRRMQWVAGPRWSRHHEHMSSMNACVSAAGRLFYVFDEAPAASIQLPSEWKLIARDAYSGVLLWKRDIASWHNWRWPLKSGPSQLPRRLVAVGDTVFATLDDEGPVEAIDAVTGETKHVFEKTRYTRELLVDDGVLFALADITPKNCDDYKYEVTNPICWNEKNRVDKEYAWDEQPQRIMAIDAKTGKTQWVINAPVMLMSIALDDERLFFHDGVKIVAHDRKTGERVWESVEVKRRPVVGLGVGATLLVKEGVVMFTGMNGRMSSYDAETGEKLWECPQPPTGHCCPLDILVQDGLVWNAAIAGGKHDGVFKGRDPRTGEIVKEFAPDVDTYWFHHRCYRAKATDEYFLTSRTGIEFVDPDAETWDINHWVRGACVYGVMPSNGLVYAPQHPCICYAEAKLTGFCALAPESVARPDLSKIDGASQLERGPAYDALLPKIESSAADWPMYRHDPARSGAASTRVGTDLSIASQCKLGGRLTAPVIANGLVLVAQIDAHTVHALDAETCEPVWSFTAGGRIDSAPTVDGGRALFGSADGYVYCLRASDGKLIWRFRAAPVDERIVSFDQVESAWPVHGAVLVKNSEVWATAGRSMFLDDGVRLLRLKVHNGELISETIHDEIDPTTGTPLQDKIRTLNMPVALTDVLSYDGNAVYMRSQAFNDAGERTVVPKPDDNATGHPTQQLGDDRHLFCPTGFLDDSWFHRGYWMYGRNFSSGCNYWFRAGRFTPAGRLLVVDGDTVYGYGRRPDLFVWTPVLEYRLFAADRDVTPERLEKAVQGTLDMNKVDNRSIFNRFLTSTVSDEEMSAIGLQWSMTGPPILTRGMVKAGDTLFVAGPHDVVNEEAVFMTPFKNELVDALAEQKAALRGDRGGELLAVSATTGQPMMHFDIDSPPVFDGMAAANGRLYMSTVDGRVVSFDSK